MNSLFKLLFSFGLCIIYSLSTAGQTEKQTIIKGKQTIKSQNVMNDIDKVIHDFFYEFQFEEKSKWYNKDVHDFTVYYTANSMKMDVTNTRYQVDYYDKQASKMALKEVVKARIVFYFKGLGDDLMMELFMEGDDGKMKPFVKTKVPKEGSFTVSEEVINMFQSGGISGSDWKGHPTLVFNHEGDTQVKEAKKQDSVAKLVRKDKTRLKIAKGVDGIDVMDAFYTKVVDGGYDLGGSDEGSLLSMIGYFLDQGLPVEIFEDVELYIRKAVNGVMVSQRVGDSQSEVSITSVETTKVPVEASKSKNIAAKNSMANKGQDKEKPKGCDCSCEKYKTLMAMSKKKKKDIDPNNMPQIDMKCIQKCAMEWSKCQK